MNTDLTSNELKSLLTYDPETGVFMWLEKRGGPRSDLKAGTNNGRGYLVIKVKGKSYRAHRLAWLYVTGEWPKNEIDHINGVRNDNRFCNLRDVTKSENQHNQKMRDGRYPGVYWHVRDERWGAKVVYKGKAIHLGYYLTEKEAFEAYLIAKKAFHDTANPNLLTE